MVHKYKITESPSGDEVGGVVHRDDDTGAYTVYDAHGKAVGGLGFSSINTNDGEIPVRSRGTTNNKGMIYGRV